MHLRFDAGGIVHRWLEKQIVLLLPAKFHEMKAHNHSASRAAGDAFKVKARGNYYL